MSNYFFLIFVVTVVIVRLFLFLCPFPSPNMKGFRIHHYMYGIVGIIIGLVAHSINLYAIGLGLFVDELTYIIIRGKDHKDNYSAVSLFGTFLFVLAIFVFRDYLVLPLK